MERWQDKAAKWLEEKAELATNSLHCADNSSTINTVHRYARILRSVAKEIREVKD